MSLNDINNLFHAKWNYKYHIVFAPRYRRKVFYKEKRAASNNPRAAGRPYYTFTRYARNRGLCLHRKNPQFYWGLLFKNSLHAKLSRIDRLYILAAVLLYVFRSVSTA